MGIATTLAVTLVVLAAATSLAAASVVPATAAAAVVATPSGAEYTPAAASIHGSVHNDDEEDDLPDGCDGVHPCGEEDNSARRQWYSHIVPVKDGNEQHGGGRPQRPTKAERDAARRRKHDEEEAALPKGCDGIHPCEAEEASAHRQWYSNIVPVKDGKEDH